MNRSHQECMSPKKRGSHALSVKALQSGAHVLRFTWLTCPWLHLYRKVCILASPLHLQSPWVRSNPLTTSVLLQYCFPMIRYRPVTLGRINLTHCFDFAGMVSKVTLSTTRPLHHGYHICYFFTRKRALDTSRE